MQDPFAPILLNSVSDKDPAILEVLGKQAASLYLKGQTVNLTAAVEKVAQAQSLNSEQLRRVCEFANKNAFRELLYTAERPEDRAAIQIPLADVQTLQSVGSGTVKVASTAYCSRYRDNAQEELEKVAAAFGTFTPDPIVPQVPYERLLNLEQAVSSLETDYGILGAELAGSNHRLQEMIKEAAASGYRKNDLQRFFMPAGSPAQVNLLMEKVAAIVPEGGTIPPGAIINDNHELMKAAKENLYLSGEFLKVAYALQKLQPELEKVRRECINALH